MINKLTELKNKSTVAVTYILTRVELVYNFYLYRLCYK